MNPSTLTTRSTSAMKKSVRFAAKIKIREHPMILGDNPSTTAGPPVCIDWEPQGESTSNLDLYEYMRGEQRKMRGGPHMDAERRRELVLTAGHSEEEIKATEQQCHRIRKLRMESMQDSKGSWGRFKKIFTKNIFKSSGSTAPLKPNSTSARTA